MASAAAKQFKFKISQPNLLCKTPGCQYYGNEIQEGFCSLCYKEYKQKQLQRSSRVDHFRNSFSRTPGSGNSGRSGNRSLDNSFESNQQQSYLFGSGNSHSGSSSPAASALSAFATLPRAAAAKLSFDSISLLPSPISNFTKFEDKKRNQIEKKSGSFRSVFRKSPTRSPVKSPEMPQSLSPLSPNAHNSGSSNSNSYSGSPRLPSHIDVDFENVREEFNEFLKPFPTAIKRDVTMKVKECANELKKLAADGTVSDLSDVTQTFYTNFRKKVDTLPIYKNLSPDERDRLMDFIERYFTLNYFKEFFSPISTAMEDEMKDLELQKKIRQLNWTSTEHLDINLNERDKEVRELIWSAITSIVEMDSVKPPHQKLTHISQCCRHILEALGKSKQAPASADDFLPALIYIVIKANPTRLQSNINYITRFSNASRLMSGEAGYFFTNLCCAVTFIQGLNADSLNMPEEEFQSYMSGKSVPPPGSWEMHFSESLHTVQEISKDLNALEGRHFKFLESVEDLKNVIHEGEERIASDVEDILQRTPLKFKVRKLPVKLDELDTTNPANSLPSPLKPQVLTGLNEGSGQDTLDHSAHIAAIYVQTEGKVNQPEGGQVTKNESTTNSNSKVQLDKTVSDHSNDVSCGEVLETSTSDKSEDSEVSDYNEAKADADLQTALLLSLKSSHLEVTANPENTSSEKIEVEGMEETSDASSEYNDKNQTEQTEDQAPSVSTEKLDDKCLPGI